MQSMRKLLVFGAIAVLVSSALALPTATIERGGATFDFKAIGERRMASGVEGENLVTHADFSAEDPGDPYRWRGGEYCYIHHRNVDRKGSMIKDVKACVVWSIKDGVAKIVKLPKILEIVGGREDFALATSGAWTKYVKLPDAKGGLYRLSFKYKMRHQSLGGKKGDGFVLTSFNQSEPGNKRVAEVPVGKLDTWRLVDSAAEWTLASRDISVPEGSVAANMLFRIDGIGEFEFKDVSFRRCIEMADEVYLHAEPVNSLDRTFYISEGHASMVVYMWKAKDPAAKYDLRKLSFDFKTTGGFEVLETPTPHSVPTNPGSGWNTHGVVVKCNAKPVSRGTLSATAFYDGRRISNTDVIELVSVSRIVAKHPRYYTTGFISGGRYIKMRLPETRKAFMESCTECGLDWVVTNDKTMAADWRKAGAKFVVSCQVGANGYRLGPLEMRKNRPADERYVTLGREELERLGVDPGTFRRGEDASLRREVELAVCPVAVYEEMPHFRNVFLPWLKEAMDGFDGDWANWEPYGFDGKGCFCLKCARAFAKYLGVPEEEVTKDWPKCVIKTSSFEGRLASKFPRFRSLEHAKLVHTIDKYVTEYTGGPEKSVGFMPGVGFDQMMSVGRGVGADWYSPKDYQEGMKWMEPWGPYPHWSYAESYVYLKSDVIRGWCAAKDIRETVDRIPADRRPRLQAFPQGQQMHTWITQPEWMRINMDSFFLNGWESTVVYFFPQGYDARWWRVFAEHTTRAAMYEDFVFKGVRTDAQNVLTPVREYAKNIPVMGGRFPQFDNVSLLQHVAYDRNGRRIVGVLNFWDFGDAFFRLQAKCLAAGDYRIVDELGVLWAPNRKKDTWTAEELATGVDLVVPSLRTRVFEIVPAAEAIAPTSVFTVSDITALYARRKPELAKAAAWDADYEAKNKVEKSTEPLGVYK